MTHPNPKSAEKSIEDRVRQVLVKELNVDPDEMTRESTMETLNADSLDVVEVILALEEEFGIEIPDDADAQNMMDANVGAIVDYVSRQVSLVP